MATGHIRLGAVGALREYILDGGPERGRRRYLANPQAEKIGSGQRKYEDDTQWDYWTMSNWQAGITREAEEGGILYGEVETRFNKKLFPSGSVAPGGLNTNVSGISDSLTMTRETGESMLPISGTVQVGTTQTRQALAINWTDVTTASNTHDGLWIYLPSSSTSVKVSLYRSTMGLSAVLEASGSAVCDAGRPGYYWFYIAYDTPWTGAATAANLSVVVEPTNAGETITVPYYDSADQMEAAKYYTGSAWATTIGLSGVDEDFFVVLDMSGHKLGTYGGDTTIVDIKRFTEATGSADVFAACGTQVYFHDTGSTDSPLVWAALGSSHSTTITSLAVFNSTLYVGLGNSTNMDKFDSALNKTADSVAGNLLLSWGGYLWRTVNNDLYYSNDGSTWSGPFEVGPDGYNITGIAGVGNDMYMATDEGLYWLAPGDFVYGIVQWDSPSSTNGVGMKTGDDGALYIPLQNRLLRYDPASGPQDIWMEQTEGLPSQRIGDIKAIVFVLGQPWVCVEPVASTDPPTVWAWNRQGWHHVGTLFAGMGINCAQFDRPLGVVHFGTDNGYVQRISVPTTGTNPLYDSSYDFAPSAWMETDWFDGRFLEREKDFESVTVVGSGFSATKSVKIYWQDDASTDWELLGTVTSDVQEVRWSDYTTRPNTKRLKLGLLFSTDSRNVPPVVEAISVKFLANIQDRYGWTLRINVSRDAHGIDGDNLDAYTRAQQRTHLDSLEGSTPPVLLEDIDDAQYEIRVMQAHQEIKNYERRQDGTVDYDAVYVWTVEQMQDNAYA